jgi:hypothetical protein
MRDRAVTLCVRTRRLSATRNPTKESQIANGDWRTLIRELLRGKSLGRAFTSIRSRQTRLVGNGLDLGSKDGGAPEYRFLSIDGQVQHSDLDPARDDVLRLDLEKPFILPDDSQDFLMLFHVLEHLYAYENCINESFRVLKPGALLVGSVPFLHRIHPDPDDYFRYSKSAIRRMFTEAGYEIIAIDSMGIGPMTAALHVIFRFIPSRSLRLVCALPAILADGVVNRITRRDWSSVYPVGYYFEVKKPERSTDSPPEAT